MTDLFECKYTPTEVMEARHILWHQSILHWKLDITQKNIYDFTLNNKEKVVVIACSRRIGKTYLLCTMAIEKCLSTPGCIVKYVAPTQQMLKQFIRPVIKEIIIDCPAELLPQYNAHDNIYKFPNGSEIQLAGTDNGNYQRLRGSNAHLSIIDEAGFCSELEDVVQSVLLPSMLLTKGKLVLSSTPPVTADHHYMKYWDVAEEKGSFICKTIYDSIEDNKKEINPRITLPMIDEMVKAYPTGVNDIRFRREYCCEKINDQDLMIIPEFIKEVQQDIIVEWPRPVHFDGYVSMDIGFQDLTVVLFAYYDFKNAVTVIEDEICINKMTTERLALLIKQKEAELWTNNLTLELIPPKKRVCDVNLIVINDLHRLHDILFFPTTKDTKDAMINELRMKIAARQIIIHPRCKKLIQHLKNGVWKKGRGEFARSADNGHYDAIDALMYLIRSIDYNHNPFPKGFEYSGMRDLFYNPYSETSTEHDKWKILLKPVNKRKV